MQKIFQKWLFVLIAGALAVTLSLFYLFQTIQAERAAERLMRLRITDVKEQVTRNENILLNLKLRRNRDMVSKAKIAADYIKTDPSYLKSSDRLEALKRLVNVDELVVINASGAISASTTQQFIGYNMYSRAQSREFMKILDNPDLEIVQDPRAIGFDGTTVMQYAGVAREDAYGVIQVAASDRTLRDAQEVADVGKLASSLRIGESGSVMVIQANKVTASAYPSVVGRYTQELAIDPVDLSDNQLFTLHIENIDFLCLSQPYAGYFITAMLPYKEAFAVRNMMLIYFVLASFLIFSAIFVLISRLVKGVVIKGINDVNTSLARITGGDLNELVSVMTNKEFISLSTGINAMVEALKRAIAEAKSRIDAELEVAKAIQHSVLPDPAAFCEGHEEFRIDAVMYTAKEVGGDFFDFFMADEDHLAVVIADVSGKGIPAALFMMNCKTLIKSKSETSLSPAQILTEANDELCATNETGFFVTVWMGILNINTGRLCYANAGHNFPLIRGADSSYGYVENVSGLVLGGMGGIKYTEYETTLHPNDMIFLYTDGVTEAINTSEEEYGDDRLLSALNDISGHEAAGLPALIKESLDGFVGKADQFDDITMTALEYKGSSISELTVSAKEENMPQVTGFTEDALTEAGCPAEMVMQFNIIVDEIFSNIYKYSGADEVTVRCGIRTGCAVLRFSDNGAPYDPLQTTAPSTKAGAEERAIGGLGILLVNQLADSVTYEYKNGYNILTILKKTEE